MIKIYTDGSCEQGRKNLSKVGGWGWVAYDESGKEICCDFDGENNTTNNRMEIKAIIKALITIPFGTNLSIYSDSIYCVNTLVSKSGMKITIPYTGWINNWKKTNYKKKLNVDLWKELDEIISKHIKFNTQITLCHVNSHCGILGNERADKLAKQGRDRFLGK